MVNWDILSLLIFFALLMLVYYRFKHKFETQGIFVMYKTQLGIKLMDRMAHIFPRFWKGLGVLGVFVGFLGMGFLLVFLVIMTWKLIFVPGTAPALAPVLPGVDIEGAPTLSFWHWILAILVAAGVHEFAHGLFSRIYNVPVKSSGFAFLGPLLAAFVEPDEKALEKKSAMQQLSVFAAGPFSNILLGIVVLVLSLFVFAPLLSNVYDGGFTITEIMQDSPMSETDLQTPFTITAINEEPIENITAFYMSLAEIQAGEEITLSTDQGDVTVVPTGRPENASIAFLGVTGFELSYKEGYIWLEPFRGVIDWFSLLILWIFLISVGVGMFNLLPLGPVDGGRMFYTLALRITKKEKLAHRLLVFFSVFSLTLIAINMVPWIIKFFVWIGSGLSILLALL